MATRLSEEQKKEIANRFSSGETIDKLSQEYLCTNSTITRNLKKSLGEKKYKELILKKRSFDQSLTKNHQNIPFSENKHNKKNSKLDINFASNIINKSEEKFFEDTPFMEITPLNYDIENTPQKDFSSIPITEVDFPKTVFMIVDKEIELEVKLLKDFPQWSFLPTEDLSRKTIQIFFELRNAKRSCAKEQKVIKVPNTDVFKIVSPILISRGISRIVCEEILIAL